MWSVCKAGHWSEISVGLGQKCHQIGQICPDLNNSTKSIKDVTNKVKSINCGTKLGSATGASNYVFLQCFAL